MEGRRAQEGALLYLENLRKELSLGPFLFELPEAAAAAGSIYSLHKKKEQSYYLPIPLKAAAPVAAAALW